jgi:hypothetical protein
LRAERALETTLAAEPLAPLLLPFVAAVLAAVRAAPRAPGTPGRPGLALPRWARSAAAALLVAAGGWLTSRASNPWPPPPTPSRRRPRADRRPRRLRPAEGAGPTPWTQAGPPARDVAASIADEAVRLPGGPTGLLAVGAALLAAAFVSARLVTRPRPDGSGR